MIQEGFSEIQAAELFDTYLRDHGVKAYFHHPFVWFGERTRFTGISNYKAYQPSERKLRRGEVFILDVAPILSGYFSDIGYTSSLGVNPLLNEAMIFLRSLREEIPLLFRRHKRGSEIWKAVDARIRDAGYENIHKKYPFSVLGHRVHKGVSENAAVSLLNFGWQSYWALLSRGLFGQLFNAQQEGDLTGLWAIEPHIGTHDFGAKFEEILVVTNEDVYWLKDVYPCTTNQSL